MLFQLFFFQLEYLSRWNRLTFDNLLSFHYHFIKNSMRYTMWKISSCNFFFPSLFFTIFFEFLFGHNQPITCILSKLWNLKNLKVFWSHFFIESPGRYWRLFEKKKNTKKPYSLFSTQNFLPLNCILCTYFCLQHFSDLWTLHYQNICNSEFRLPFTNRGLKCSMLLKITVICFNCKNKSLFIDHSMFSKSKQFQDSAQKLRLTNQWTKRVKVIIFSRDKAVKKKSGNFH